MNNREVDVAILPWGPGAVKEQLADSDSDLTPSNLAEATLHLAANVDVDVQYYQLLYFDPYVYVEPRIVVEGNGGRTPASNTSIRIYLSGIYLST